MASSGKKNKKGKKVSMTLEQFLKDVPQTPIRKSTDWADIVEDESDAFEPRPKQNIVLPTAPRAARVPVSNDANIPQDPPYVAYISNLTYDVDEKDLADFFRNLKITNIRLPREDREPGKLRGFGYVEFADRNNLIQAMTLSDTSLKGRRMRIEVSTNDEKKRIGGGMGGNRNMDMQRDRPDRSESSGDWRSGPRQESSFQESAPIERRSGFNNRDTYEPPSSNKPGAWRDATNDRPPTFRDNRDNRDERRGDRGFGGGRRNYNDREEGFTRRNYSRDDDNRSESSEPRTRPKLILAPRKEPIATEPAPAPAAAPTAPSIFGAAKPVDTSARERQIEERLAREREMKAAEIKKETELAKAKEEAEKEISRPPVVENSWRTAREETNNQDVTKKDSSPVRRRDSPRRDNSRRRDSPKRAVGDSPQRNSRRDSPSSRRRGDSPPRRRDSPLRKRDGSPRRRDGGSPIRRRDSPQRRRDAPPTSRRNDDRRDRGSRLDQSTRGADRERGERDPRSNQRNTYNNTSNKSRFDDKPHKERNNVETKERNVEDRMPKLKEQEAPNFAASNKFAFLDTEDTSD